MQHQPHGNGLKVGHFGHFAINFGCNGSNFFRTLITFTLFSYRNFFISGFFFTDNEEVGDAFELVITDFATDFLVAVFDDGAHVEFVQFVSHVVGIVVELLADG